MSNAIPVPQPGDCLLYSEPSFVDAVIQWKTASPVAHVEVYEGHMQSLASRNGIGVNRYPLRLDGLVALLRPNLPFDMAKASAWFETVKGQGYDWAGLLRFANIHAKGQPNHLFCSAFGTLLYRAGNLIASNLKWPAGLVEPGEFLKSPAFDWLYMTFNLE